MENVTISEYDCNVNGPNGRRGIVPDHIPIINGMGWIRSILSQYAAGYSFPEIYLSTEELLEASAFLGQTVVGSGIRAVRDRAFVWIQETYLFELAELQEVSRASRRHFLKGTGLGPGEGADVGRVLTFQMETEQGVVDQGSDKNSNTIITRDQSQTIGIEKGITNINLRDICSTEPEHTFDSITNRWMAIDNIKVTTSNNFNEMLAVYNLPSFLYSEKYAPNMMPFRNFVYGAYEVEFKFVVNANKFHVGKVIAAIKADSYQIDTIRNDVTTMLARPHIILDLAANNEGVLRLPFKYHRTYLRNVASSPAQYTTKTGQYGTINVAILSPLRAVTGAPIAMYIRPFYRIVNARFTGMNREVPLVQMEGLLLEEGLKYAGKILNLDKPTDLVRQAQYVPKPRMNFCTGKGPSDATPIKLDPAALTTFLPDHDFPEDPTTTYDIARIWGFVGAFEWNMNDDVGKALYNMPIDPTWRVATNWTGVPTPLEYISSMYQFWSGPLEIRLDFVSNSFHTGAVMLSCEYGRTSDGVPQSSATYTKTFHLGEQKTVTMVLPYIFDTVWRRTQCVPFSPLVTNKELNSSQGQNAVIRSLGSMFYIRVVNELVPVQSVTQVINVLVFIRAGEHFRLHSPIMANLLNSDISYTMNQFPGDYTTAGDNSQTRVADLVGRTGKQVRAWLSEGKSSVNSGRETPQAASLVAEVRRRRPKKLGRKKTYYDIAEPLEAQDRIIWESEDGKEEFTYMGTAKQYFVRSTGKWYTQHEMLAAFPKQKDIIIELMRAYDVPEEELPKAQMETGEKENPDATLCFRQGISRRNIQTVEDHMDIKDLLRRPVCIIDKGELPAFTGSNYYYIPCMPPSHMMVPSATGVNGIYAVALGRSYHVHLMDLFRFWRGSQRLTIFVESVAATPVYVTYVPHSGNRNSGVISYESNVVFLEYITPGSVGLGTEVILPSVNPSITVEVPFETEDNWALTFNENPTRNFTWRDKGETNCGHLILWSKAATNFSVWWAAGDDYKVANFVGPPTCVAGIGKQYYTDNYPQPQMEEEKSVGKMGAIKKFVASNAGIARDVALTCAGAAINPAATVAVGAYRAFGTMGKVHEVCGTTAETMRDVQETSVVARETMQRTTAMVEETTESARTMMDTATGMMNETSVCIRNSVTETVEWLKNTFQWTADICSCVFDALLDFISWMRHKDWFSAAIGLGRMFANILGVGFDKIGSYCSHFGDLCRSLINLVTQRADPNVPQTQISPELYSESWWEAPSVQRAVTAVIAMVCMVVGVKAEAFPRGSFMKRLGTFAFSVKGLSIISHSMRIVSYLIALVQDVTIWALGLVNVEAKSLQAIADKNQFFKNFVEESQRMLDEANSQCFVLPSFKLRFYANYQRALQIQAALAPLGSNKIAPIVNRTCAEVISKAKEKMADMRSSPVKYEPFVIHISGASGIGKSTMVRKMVDVLLKSVGIDGYVGDPIYYRMQGSKFWSGYYDQPCVVLDEWMNINDPILCGETAAELFQLKSCATFIPEQAALEDKKARASPKLVVLLSNNTHPKCIEQLATHAEAVYRRRDVVLEASLAMPYQGQKVKNIDKNVTTKFGHLRFRHVEPLPGAGSSSIFVDDKMFDWDGITEMLKKEFHEYDKHETEMMQERFKIIADSAGFDASNFTVDPYCEFRKKMNRVREDTSTIYLPSEILREQVEEINNALRNSPLMSQGVQNAITSNLMSDAGVPIEQMSPEVFALTACAISFSPIIIEKCVRYYREWKGTPTEYKCPTCSIEEEMILQCSSCRVRTCYGCAQEECCRECNNHYIFYIDAFLYAKILVSIYRLAKNEVAWADSPLLTQMEHVGFVLERLRFWTVQYKIQKGDEVVVVYNPIMRSDPVVGERVVAQIEVDDEQPTCSRYVRRTSPFRKSGLSVASIAPWLFNEAYYQKDWMQASSCAIEHYKNCIHMESMRFMGCVMFEDQQFKISTREGIWQPWPRKCVEECPWSNSEWRREFCEAFFNEKKEGLRAYVNQIPHNYSLQQRIEYLARRMPSFMYPHDAVMEEAAPQAMILFDPTRWWEKLFGCDNLIRILKIAGALVAAFGVFKLGNSIWKLMQSPTEQLVASGDATVRHFRKIHQVRRVQHIRPQSEQMRNDVMRAVINNTVCFTVALNGKSRRLNGLGLRQRIVLLPRHYYYALEKAAKDGAEITFGKVDQIQTIKYSFCAQDFILSETSDICVFYAPASVNLFKNITHFIARDEDLTRKRSSEGFLLRVPSVECPQFISYDVEIKRFLAKQIIEDSTGRVEINDVAEYNFSDPGACGSVFVSYDHQRPIMSFHVAGRGDKTRGLGYGVLLTQEMLEEIPNDPVSAQAQEYEEPAWLRESQDGDLHLPEQSNVTMLGRVEHKLVPYSPTKTKIKPSLISPLLKWPNAREPVILTPRDPRYTHEISPLVAGCAKHGYLTSDIPSSDLDEVREIRYTQLLKIKPHVVGATRLTPEEAISGFPHVEHYDTMQLNTSAGWPYCTNKNKGTLKRNYCSVEKDAEGNVTECTIDDEVMAVVRKNEALRREGIVPATLFVDTLKDERKKPASVMKLGGTRVFCASPMDFTIAMRQNYLHFVAAYMKNRHKLGHAVGINIAGSEVTTLVDSLLHVGTNIITLDYSNFGPGFNAGVAASVKKNFNDWTKQNVADVNEAELDCLMEENINSLHIMHNVVYRQKGGSPSGSPITVVINSEVNLHYIMLAWLHCCREVPNLWVEFYENVVVYVYGDDAIISVSDKYIERFNGETIQAYFSQYGIVATDAIKTGKMKKKEELANAPFLKCKFARHPKWRNEWIAALELDSVHDTAHWIQEPIQLKEATYVNALACVRNAYGHGKAKFDEIRDEVNRALAAAKCETVTLTWQEVDREGYPQYYYGEI